MLEKIKIQIFGRKDQLVSAPCGCDPDTDCGPNEDSTTIELFEGLKTFLEDTDVNEKFDIEFIDIDKDDLSKYPKESKSINAGYQLPITFISGRVAFSGQVDNMKTYLILKRLSK